MDFSIFNIFAGFCGLYCFTSVILYIPNIYVEGYIAFVFPFVRSRVRMYVRSLVMLVKFTLKFC